MEEPSSSAQGPPTRQPSPSMLSIYLQRTSSGQLAAQPRLEASASLGQSSASTGPPGPSAEPSPRLLGAQSQRQETAPSPFNVPFQREGASTGGTPSFFPSTSSIPISQRSSSQQALSQSSTDLPPGGQASRQAMVAALSPSRSSFGSGYSLHSGAGDEPPGAAEAAAGEAGGGGQLPRGVASGRLSAAAGGSGGGFSNVTDEELAAMDPKRAKRLIANRQSAQRSKARKLRHIMQLEEEVGTLQGISAQQLATINGLQQEASLLTSSNRQLSAQVEELQDALHKQETFTELVIAELRRLSVLAGEPVQLPAFPPPSLQEQQLQAQEFMPGAQLGSQLSDMALQQQLASQYGLSSFAGGGFQPYPAGMAAAQQFQAVYVPQFGALPVGTMQSPPHQRAGGLMEGGPGGYYQPPQQQRQSRQQHPRQQQQQQQRPRQPPPQPPQPPPQQRPQSRLLAQQQPPDRPSAAQQGPAAQGEPSPRASLERPSSAPLPAAVAEAAAATAFGQQQQAQAAAGDGAAAQQPQQQQQQQPHSTEAVREAAMQALALAERRSVRFSADLPQRDAAAESRRQALATAGRGNTFPLARGEAAARRAAVRTLSEPVNSPTAAAGGGSGGAGAGEQQPQPPPRQDPFRVNMPASAFQVEERRPSTEMASRRQQQQLQQFAAVPEQSDVQSWQQPQQMGWPLGARAQQPYPGAAGPVGNVMQAFRGISLQGVASDPSTGLPPSGLAQRLGSQLPPAAGFSMQPGGRYSNLSWDDMMRSLSDPVFQTGHDGTPLIPPGMYAQGMEGMGLSSRGPFESFYNVEQPEQGEQLQQQQQQQQLPQPPPGEEGSRQR